MGCDLAGGGGWMFDARVIADNDDGVITYT